MVIMFLRALLIISSHALLSWAHTVYPNDRILIEADDSPSVPEYSGWAKHRGYNQKTFYDVEAPSECLEGGFDNKPKVPAMLCLYKHYQVPSATDIGWTPTPNAEIINMFEASLLCGAPATCFEYLDFTYFQTNVYIPLGYPLETFSIRYGQMDDFIRVKVYNSRYPDGYETTEDDMFVFNANAGIFSNLAKHLEVGEVNRIVLIQLDMCCDKNNFGSARLQINNGDLKFNPAGEHFGIHHSVERMIYLKPNSYPPRTTQCEYIMENSSSYTGKWIARGIASVGDGRPSCLTKVAGSDRCQTWDNINDCYAHTNDVVFDPAMLHLCSDAASASSHSWCYRTRVAKWANCIFAFNTNSQFYGKWVIARKNNMDSIHCYESAEGKCFSYGSYFECQAQADSLQEQFELEGFDRFGKECTRSDLKLGWCQAAYLLL